jgi:phenylacetate-coenzyme A ligase PaaK-like adenylate-forming protein
MNVVDQLFEAPQYSMPQAEKERLILQATTSLTQWHQKKCEPYARVLNNLYSGAPANGVSKLEALPYLPVRLFKELNLQSIADEQIVKTLTSSGTSHNGLSRIVLDDETAQRQRRALATIMTSFLGSKRLPMIFIDTKDVFKDRAAFSARGAGLLGMANFGRKHFYALDKDMQLDHEGLHEFMETWAGQDVLIFGFTFMIWQYLYGNFQKTGKKVALGENSILIHSGGWKALLDQAVSGEVFKSELKKIFGLTRIHDFYGMVEQVGSVYMQCEQGHLHAPNFSDILVRSFHDWETLPVGEQGIIQTISVLPTSYPGHSLLTEDLGTIIGVDDCPCGRKGKYFRVDGRIPKSELRGCSDTHAQVA